MNEKETLRMEAFSDAVFAVAITFLVFNLKVPDPGKNLSSQALIRALLAQGPSYLAFVTSFATILIVWVNHHGIFTLVHRTNVPFLFANGLLLMLVTIVPFPTALLSEYLKTPAASVAVAVYSATFLFMDLAFNVLWHVASHNRALLKAGVPDVALQKITRYYLMGYPLYIVAVVMAFVNEYISLGICTVLWIFWALKGAHRQAELAKRRS
jgi:uncharacterized membrane protein